MEDDHQSTLKKKIQILFQLGKYPDVVKLCESYGEKYGKDMEVDMICFKSERHMGIPAPAPEKPAAETEKAEAARPDQPLVLAPEDRAVQNPAVLIESLSVKEEAPALKENDVRYKPADDEDEPIIGDPFVENELVITDPFAPDEPELSLAPDEPPVTVDDHDESPPVEIVSSPALEMDEDTELADEADIEKNEIDLSKFAGMTIDADPDLISMKPQPEPAEPFFVERKEEVLEDLSRSSSGGVDIIEEPARPVPEATFQPEPDEKPLPPSAPFRDFLDQKPAPRRKTVNIKLLLLIILPLIAAAVLWLALSGKLNFSGAEAQPVESEAAAKPPVKTPLEQPAPVKKITPPAEIPKVDETGKLFDEKFKQADELYKKGELLKAWAVVLEAKKIKMTEPLRLLEEQLAQKIRAAEAQAKQETEVVLGQQQLESQAFAKAEADATLAAWQDFLKAYPDGEFSLKAARRLAMLEKKAQEKADQQLMLKIKQAQKIKLRAAYLSISQAEIAPLLRQSGKPPTQFEVHEHGGSRVILDYASGLMWTLWNKPMAYDKAKWWANRVTAGYGSWRLPTVEEALSLLQMDRGQYAGLGGLAVWTGDTVSDQPRSIWVLKIPEGQFTAQNYDQVFYVWAVRQAGK
jgi:hypothetical protein